MSADNGTTCNDGTFCNGADTCSGGSCSNHAGDPCPGADGDSNCSESCNEGSDTCNAADPNGAACDDGDECTASDSCSAGVCEGTPPAEPLPGCVTTTTIADCLCGDVTGDLKVKAGDALITLNVSVGIGECLPCACDFNGNGTITAGDALGILRTAVSLPTDPNCPEAGADQAATTTVPIVTTTTSEMP